jgi:hypothetical protein
MAATTANLSLEPAGALVCSRCRVTLTSVTAYSWDTRLRKVIDAGYEIVSGTGGKGDCLKSTTVNGRVEYGSVDVFVDGDVLDLFAYGEL